MGSTGLFSTQTILFISNGVLGYHGIAHDAGGFLQKSFGIGPGYQYIGEVSTVDFGGKTSALSGQVSGILYWAKKLRTQPHNYDPSVADRLWIISGIGSKIQDALYEESIRTYSHLEEADISKLKEILKKRNFIASPDTWPKQARLVSDGRWDELEKFQEKLNQDPELTLEQ